MAYGKKNIVAGLLFLAFFMAYGFVLIYLRDFAPGKQAWISAYSTGTHFESRLAHVHGNLFAFLNIMLGYLIIRLPISAISAKWVSWLLHLKGLYTGLACADGLYMNQRQLHTQNGMDWDNAQRLLINRSVQVVVQESK